MGEVDDHLGSLPGLARLVWPCKAALSSEGGLVGGPSIFPLGMNLPWCFTLLFKQDFLL